jgi:hypothetical protein
LNAHLDAALPGLSAWRGCCAEALASTILVFSMAGLYASALFALTTRLGSLPSLREQGETPLRLI